MPCAGAMVAAYQIGREFAEDLAEDSVGERHEAFLDEALRFECLAVLLHDLVQEEIDELLEQAA